jgi:ubiquinone/menaquinone biosynthesis C-methylase UbiE
MKKQRRSLRLLPKTSLIKTGPVDHADWNFRPFLGWIQRLRFRLIMRLFPSQQVNRLLEVGYGSGVLMPDLANRCIELYGIDIHHKNQEVANCLKDFGITANLYVGSAETMPFENQFFDCVVAISSLEFIENIELACKEIHRILKPYGFLVLVTPGNSPVVDFGFSLLTGKSAQRAFGNRRQLILPTLLRYFRIDAKESCPPIGSSIICLYTSLRMSPKITGSET